MACQIRVANFFDDGGGCRCRDGCVGEWRLVFVQHFARNRYFGADACDIEIGNRFLNVVPGNRIEYGLVVEGIQRAGGVFVGRKGVLSVLVGFYKIIVGRPDAVTDIPVFIFDDTEIVVAIVTKVFFASRGRQCKVIRIAWYHFQRIVHFYLVPFRIANFLACKCLLPNDIAFAIKNLDCQVVGRAVFCQAKINPVDKRLRGYEFLRHC